LERSQAQDHLPEVGLRIHVDTGAELRALDCRPRQQVSRATVASESPNGSQLVGPEHYGVTGSAGVRRASAPRLVQEVPNRAGRDQGLIAESDDHLECTGQGRYATAERDCLSVLPIGADHRLSTAESGTLQQGLGVCAEHDDDPVELGDRALRADRMLDEWESVQLGEELGLGPEPGARARGQDEARDQTGTSRLDPNDSITTAAQR
jgi:hypothetical protein